MLTSRQERILCKVVDDYLRTGQPVASKSIAADPEFDCGPSTVRNELALLEEQGLLAHPHVSAGRVPTDAGHRYVVDRMLSSGEGLAVQRRLELSLIRSEVEAGDAHDLRDALADDEPARGRLGAVAEHGDDPSRRGAGAAAGGRDGRRHHLDRRRIEAVRDVRSAGRPGPAGVGRRVPARAARRSRPRRAHVAAAPDRSEPLGASSSRSSSGWLPAFGDLAAEAEDDLYVDGTARLFSAGQIEDATQLEGLVGLLERRVSLLRVLRAALGQPGVYVRIGRENEIPAMRSLALVATGYGVASASSARCR